MRSSSALSLHSETRGSFERAQLATSSSVSSVTRPELGTADAGMVGSPPKSPSEALETNSGSARTPDPIATPPSMARDEVMLIQNGVAVATSLAAVTEAAPDMSKAAAVVQTPQGLRAAQDIPEGYRQSTPASEMRLAPASPMLASIASTRPLTPRGSVELPTAARPAVGQMVQSSPGPAAWPMTMRSTPTTAMLAPQTQMLQQQQQRQPQQFSSGVLGSQRTTPMMIPQAAAQAFVAGAMPQSVRLTR